MNHCVLDSSPVPAPDRFLEQENYEHHTALCRLQQEKRHRTSLECSKLFTFHYVNENSNVRKTGVDAHINSSDLD